MPTPLLPAIDLHDEARLEAEEIEDIVSERHLALEFQPFELPVAQGLPQEVFGLGGVCPHVSGMFAVRGPDEAVDHV